MTQAMTQEATVATPKERGILFSAPMVRAILDGRKTVTRREFKLRGWLATHRTRLESAWPDRGLGSGGYLKVPHCHPNDIPPERVSDWMVERVRCPYGAVGDRLWVRETWSPWADEKTQGYLIDTGDADAWLPCVYRATVGQCTSLDAGGDGRWHPAIHMPRRFSRITLEVVDVRVERLQAITEEDAEAEGVTPFPKDPEGDCWTDGKHRTAFEFLWNEINGWDPNSWASNPWVWRIGFRLVTPLQGEGSE